MKQHQFIFSPFLSFKFLSCKAQELKRLHNQQKENVNFLVLNVVHLSEGPSAASQIACTCSPRQDLLQHTVRLSVTSGLLPFTLGISLCVVSHTVEYSVLCISCLHSSHCSCPGMDSIFPSWKTLLCIEKYLIASSSLLIRFYQCPFKFHCCKSKITLEISIRMVLFSVTSHQCPR